jgi:hypothetical protein
MVLSKWDTSIGARYAIAGGAIGSAARRIFFNGTERAKNTRVREGV